MSTLPGPTEKIVAYTSGPFMSPVIGPPEWPSVIGSARVRSGLSASQFVPPSVVRHNRFDDAYNTFASMGEKMIGKVHCQRSTMSIAGSPE